MKKITGFLMLSLVGCVISCSNQTTEEKKQPEVIKKEVIIVPAPQVEKKAPEVKIKTEEQPTSIVVDKNGVKVQTKKISVNVNPK